MRMLYMDCFSGVSGDMTVGALIDAGAPFPPIESALASLGVPGFHVTADKVVKRGVTATQFRVHVDPGTDKPHRHLRHIVDIIRQGALSDRVKSGALATFQRIAVAEAAIHGIDVEQVHFHEVGAIDSIVDIVAAHVALELLGVDRVIASPVAVGSGVIHCGHGVMPVPAPATTALLQGVPIHGGGVEAELTTPTGAALVREWAAGFGEMPPMNMLAMGHGAGMRDLPDRANVLRVVLGETSDAAPNLDGLGEPGKIIVIETMLDDMSGEMIAPAMEALLAAGARDAFVTPVLGKKSRPAHLLTVLCDAEQMPDVAKALFDNTTTLGLRFRQEQRLTLKRSWKTVDTVYGPVRVKLGFGPMTVVFHPEFEDCRTRAAETGVPVWCVAEAARLAAMEEERAL